MLTISHNTVVQSLLGSRSAKEGTPLANQLMFFSLLWVVITASISYIGWNTLSSERPISWLMILLPLMGAYLFILAFQCHLFWSGLGKASLHLAKVAFHYNDNIQGYVEYKDLTWHGGTEASAHISLKKKLESGKYREEWITKADTQIAPGSNGIRISFSTLVRPSLDEVPSPQQYTWCLHIKLKHNKENYKQSFEIPMDQKKDSGT